MVHCRMRVKYDEGSDASLEKPIAILDSGVGGLTVVKEVMRQLPLERVIYYGDTLRAPYGPRPEHEVRMFTRQIVDYLLNFDPKMIVIACNTATAVALEEIRSMTDVPVVGVIQPGARAAIKRSKNGQIGVIGTEGTIRSGAYEQALKRIAPHLEVFSKACPRFVPLVEQGLYHSLICDEVIAEELQEFRQSDIDCMILGCTHYPFIAEKISAYLGPGVELISSAEETAREISTLLYHKGQLASGREMPVHQFFCSGDADLFRRIAREWLDAEIEVSTVVWQTPRLV